MGSGVPDLPVDTSDDQTPGAGQDSLPEANPGSETEAGIPPSVLKPEEDIHLMPQCPDHHVPMARYSETKAVCPTCGREVQIG